MARDGPPSLAALELLHYLQDDYGYMRSNPNTSSETWRLIWWFVKQQLGDPAKVYPLAGGRLGGFTGPGVEVAGVTSIRKAGAALLTGDVTLSEGANVTLTQVGQDIAIAAAGATGGRTKLFDSTLGAAAASIDTGAGGIATTFDLLEVYLFARTDEAVVPSALTITLNNDASAIYDIQFTRSVNTTVSGAAAVASAGWSIATAGANNAAGCFGAFCFTFPTYAQTVGHKVGSLVHGWADGTAANARTQNSTLRYRSTTAISRMKVAAPGGSNLIAGSRLLIYGT